MTQPAHGQTNLSVLNKRKPIELVLPLESFSGGENTIAEDQAVKANEARTIENWESTSLGGMIRNLGINRVADGGVSYSDASDFLIHHDEAGSQVVYGTIAGDLVKKSGGSIIQEDAAAFTSGVLCHGVSVGSVLYVTNSTDNIKRKTIGNPIAALTNPPATACARLYFHKSRLIAEGSASLPRRVYGSRAGTGNFNAADGFSLANDAWNLDLPDDTRGCVPGFPSGDELLVFTRYGAYAVSNFPNVAFRPIPGSKGCEAPYSIAVGDEGIFFVSRYPTLGVFLFDGTNFIELTQFNRDSFVETIDLTKRIFGIYRNKKYYVIYNESGSGATYPNRIRIYDTRFGRWHSRPINTALADNMGYPCLLTKSQNELYAASSRNDYWYELETGTDDEGNNTEANYKTKDFSSRDFFLASGGQFPIDDVRMKLTKVTVDYYGLSGTFSIQWNSDRGKYSGSQTFDLTSDGDKINTTFIVNTSMILAGTPDKTITKQFSNAAVGRKFNFQVLQNGQSTRPEIKKIKIHAIALEEN